jgi:hypothetical protein
MERLAAQAVRKRYSVWKQSADFRGGKSDPIPKITGDG